MDFINFREHYLYEPSNYPPTLPYNLSGGPWHQLPPRRPREEGKAISFRHIERERLNQTPSALVYTEYEFCLIMALLTYVHVTHNGLPHFHINSDKTFRRSHPFDPQRQQDPKRLGYSKVGEIAYCQTFGWAGSSPVLELFNHKFEIQERDDRPRQQERLVLGLLEEVFMRPTYWMDEVRDAWKTWRRLGGRLSDIPTPQDLLILLPGNRLRQGTGWPYCHEEYEEYRQGGEPLYEGRVGGQNATYTLRGPLVESSQGGSSSSRRH